MSRSNEVVPQVARAALVAHVARLKHDLGKYVALRQRWLGPDAPLEERGAALADDVLSTRRGPEGTLDALSVWSEFRPALVGEVALPGGHVVDLSADADVAALQASMDVLADVVVSLRAGDTSDAVVRRGSEAAIRVSDLCRALDRRVKAGKDLAAGEPAGPLAQRDPG